MDTKILPPLSYLHRTNNLLIYNQTNVLIGEEVRELEGANAKIGELFPVNIPIQMLAITDRDGKVTPIWFRFETEEHVIEKIAIEKTISRDESNSVGVREKKFICSAIISGERRLMELRYHVENQKWRIFQFLS